VAASSSGVTGPSSTKVPSSQPAASGSSGACTNLTLWGIPADKDTTLGPRNGNGAGACVDPSNHGADPTLRANSNQRFVVGFNLASVPTTQVTGARLDLTLSCASNCVAATGNLNVHALARDFDEGDGTSGSGATWCNALGGAVTTGSNITWAAGGADNVPQDHLAAVTTVAADGSLAIDLPPALVTAAILNNRVGFLLDDDTGNLVVNSRNASTGKPTLTLTVCGN